ncbi:MAG TPA: GNAT family N-acetyltransferase [Candidatus Saccharimonadales bacterium]|nr:GNAT family N-acetyltransferase [Candidatus Saccharimonadales bacterium]
MSVEGLHQVERFKQYYKTRFTSKQMVQRAAEFDFSIFSQDRGEVTQPTYEYKTYERLFALGIAEFTGYVDPTGEIAAMGGIMTGPDPEAEESMLQNLKHDTAYMWVLATSPKFSGNGLGGQVLKDSIEIAKKAGKTKMITTVHPNNYNSLSAFFKNGFVAVGRVCNYYNMTGSDGERLILMNGDLDNDQWADQITGPYSVSVAIPDFTLEKMDEIESTINFFGFEMGMASRGCFRLNENTVSLKPYRYLGDIVEVAKLIYPYESFAEAYLSALSQIKNMNLFDRITLANLQAFSERMNVGGQPESPLFAIHKSQTHKLFMQWLSDYRSHYLKSPTKIDDFESSLEAATMQNDLPLVELIYIYLSVENSVVLNLLDIKKTNHEYAPPQFDAYIKIGNRPNNMRERAIFKDASKELLRRNLLMHAALEATIPKTAKEKIRMFAASFKT